MQCSIQPGYSGSASGDYESMKKLDTLTQSLLALSVAVLPAAATLLDQMDQSMRRPSLARVVLHSLQFAF